MCVHYQRTLDHACHLYHPGIMTSQQVLALPFTMVAVVATGTSSLPNSNASKGVLMAELIVCDQVERLFIYVNAIFGKIII